MRVAVLSLILASACASPAFAQQPKPLPPFVFDVRGMYPTIGRTATTATDLGVLATDLPGRGLGASIGMQAYLWRSTGLALGIGVEAMEASGESHINDENGRSILAIHERVRGFGGSLSLNFGHREGWSYLSAGTGPMRFESYLGDTSPASPPAGKSTLNVGGGGRWFTTPHIAFSFDVRVYLAKAIPTTATTIGRDKKKLVVIAVGISLK